MEKRCNREVTALKASGFLIVAFLFVIAGTWRVAAQDGTPSPQATDVGVCTTALGIGTEGDACLNVVHVAPDAPAVDVYVDGQQALTGLAFGAASGWVALPAGEHQVQVTAAGTAADQAVIDAELTVEEGAAYEVAAVGLLEAIETQVNQVNLSEMGDDEARIRFVHTSPDAPAVDVAVKGGEVLVPELAFPDTSDYLTVPADTYDLEVRVGGTPDVALDLPDVNLEAGMVYSVYAIGQVADGTLTVLPITSTTDASMMATPTA